MLAITSIEFREGEEAFDAHERLDANPYMRPSDAWRDWREGWAQAQWETWQAALMDKRTASTT